MELIAIVSVIIAAGALGLVLLVKKSQRSRQNLPPERSGWIPWLGCAVAFRKAPLQFIEDTRKAVGSYITVKLPHPTKLIFLFL